MQLCPRIPMTWHLQCNIYSSSLALRNLCSNEEKKAKHFFRNSENGFLIKKPSLPTEQLSKQSRLKRTKNALPGKSEKRKIYKYNVDPLNFHGEFLKDQGPS